MKIKFLIILLIIVVIVITSVYFLIPKNIICTNFILDEEHLINETEIPQGTWKEKTCPNGDKVEYITLIESKGPDSAWRKILYCKEDKVFWVADMWGFGLNWYGLFEGKPCLW